MTNYQKLKLLKKFHLISKSKYKKKIARYSTEYRAIADSGLFSAKWYLKHNPDVKAEGIDPVQHYLQYGWKENRECTPYFDNDQYLTDNPDVNVADMNPLVHWLIHGQNEGRMAVVKKYVFIRKIHQVLLYPLEVYEEYRVLSAELKALEQK